MRLEEGRDYFVASTFETFLIALPGIPIYFFFRNALDQPFRGFVAAVSFSTIVFVGWMTRPWAKTRAFWITLSAIAAFHMLLIATLPYTGHFSFGILLTPFVFVDIYLSGKAIVFMSQRETGDVS